MSEYNRNSSGGRNFEHRGLEGGTLSSYSSTGHRSSSGTSSHTKSTAAHTSTGRRDTAMNRAAAGRSGHTSGRYKKKRRNRLDITQILLTVPVSWHSLQLNFGSSASAGRPLAASRAARFAFCPEAAARAAVKGDPDSGDCLPRVRWGQRGRRGDRIGCRTGEYRGRWSGDRQRRQYLWNDAGGGAQGDP